MKTLQSSILGLASLSFIFIGVLDGRFNTTKSVIDGTFIQNIERVKPYTAIDGTQYVRKQIDRERGVFRNAHRKHCYVGARFQGFKSSDCGTIETR